MANTRNRNNPINYAAELRRNEDQYERMVSAHNGVANPMMAGAGVIQGKVVVAATDSRIALESQMFGMGANGSKDPSQPFVYPSIGSATTSSWNQWNLAPTEKNKYDIPVLHLPAIQPRPYNS